MEGPTSHSDFSQRLRLARHLTIHGSKQNEDGTFSWKFDNDVRNFSPVRLPFDAQHALWSRSFLAD